MDTHCNRVLRYMEIFGGITQMQANKALGVSRLSGRIFDLKQRGYQIYDEWIVVKNRYGEKCRVKEYKLKGVNKDG